MPVLIVLKALVSDKVRCQHIEQNDCWIIFYMASISFFGAQKYSFPTKLHGIVALFILYVC